jgi:hypothetical protein
MRISAADRKVYVKGEDELLHEVTDMGVVVHEHEAEVQLYGRESPFPMNILRTDGATMIMGGVTVKLPSAGDDLKK